MKKFTIFVILLFFVTAIWHHPSRVSVGTGVTERFIERLSVFEDSADTITVHVAILSDLKSELEFLTFRYTSIPDTFEEYGTLNGIFMLLETVAITLVDFLSGPLYIVTALITFIVDAIVLIFKLFSILDLFTVTI